MENIINILVVSGKNNENKNQIVAQLSNHDDFHIVGVVKNDADAIIKSIAIKPDVLILDLQPPGLDGIELAPLIHRRSPSSAIILMSEKNEDYYACIALRAGISGFLVNEEDKDRLVSIVRIVYSGGYYFNSSITDRIFDTVLLMEYFPGQSAHFSQFEQKNIADCPPFSPTERSIVICLARGYADKEIAECLHLNIGSIRNCLSSIRRKTKLKSRVHIAIFSLMYGIIKFEHFNI
jgi:DNA-binding NarL/FixJ family response regulator